MKFDEQYFYKTLKELLDIDSTTSQYVQIQKYIVSKISGLGYKYEETYKGGVIACLGGECNPLTITAHFDDIGLMVRKINKDGTLNVCNVGGLHSFYCIGENVRIYTRDGKVYTGTVCRTPNSIHVTEEELRSTLPDFRTNVCVVIDCDVTSDEDVRKLGIETGDIIALEPRYTQSNGYIKSRFVDDKAAVAILLTYMKELKEENITLSRKVYVYFSAYEEIGHGTVYMPKDTKDMLAIDIAPTGPDQTSNEHKVSIFAKDSRYPYHYELTNELIKVAKDTNVDYVVDVFTPHYGTDCDGSILAGYDIRHSAIGFGTSNSHGYERTHIDGIKNTYKLLDAFVK